MNINYRTQQFSNFSRALHTSAFCFRPDNEWQLHDIIQENKQDGLLARGHGLSYSDCCVLNQGTIIDTRRLNHLLSFEPKSGLAVCQGAATFSDLFCFDSRFIPPVLPGTLHATLAGGVANDIHGKNNHITGTLGSHIEWLELELNHQTLECSRDQNSDLFFATLAGIGLTGVIRRIGIRLRKATRFVVQQSEQHTDFAQMLQRMETEGVKHDYQVAWIDWLNSSRAVLSFADHCEQPSDDTSTMYSNSKHTIPKLPIRLINRWLIKQFNRFYYHQTSAAPQTMPLGQFNNPLDTIDHWNRLYGKQGLLQFQSVFPAKNALTLLDNIKTIIDSHKTFPTLTVLKYFTQPGPGLLSFACPGFTIAIDFIHNPQARTAIRALNELILRSGGKIYLAKDLLLTKMQFKTMYPNHQIFSEICTKYNSPMKSDMGKRLGLHQ